MKLRTVTISIASKDKPLTHLHFAADTNADAVRVIASNEAPGGAMLSVPLPADVPRTFLKSVPQDVNMSRLINGVIDGEVIVDYAKYAIEYLVSLHGDKS